MTPAGLLGFAAYSAWVHGPVSPFLPGAYEPALLVMGGLYAPLLVAIVGTAASLPVEALNYRLHAGALTRPALARLSEGRLSRWVVRLFNRSPFLAVWVGTWSPLPDWSLRVVAPMAQYPLRHYLLAMGLGRLPRFWVVAAVGRFWGVPTWIGAAGVGLSLVAGAGVLAWKVVGWRRA